MTLKARFNGLKVDGFSRGAGAADFQSTLKRASPITLRLAPALKRWSNNPSGKASEDAYLRSWVNELQITPVNLDLASGQLLGNWFSELFLFRRAG